MANFVATVTSKAKINDFWYFFFTPQADPFWKKILKNRHFLAFVTNSKLHLFSDFRALKDVFLQVFQEVGLPPGVLNLVHGLGSKAGEALVQHPDVKVISFTGSTLIGRHIAKVAAPMMKKLSLELGGKNAALVFADAKLDQA